MRRICIAFAAVMLCAALAPAQARTRGLLVGVSEYPGFAPEKQLNAPKNDVRNFKDMLIGRGLALSDLTVLADGVEGSAELPTRAAILAQMKQLAIDATRGDLIIIYASGHGSRQKSTTGRKLDGLDQVFLPRDAARAEASDASGNFRNAIVSHEIGDHLDAIRAKGADVWFVLDSCFSGSASRAFGDGVRDKQIEPSDIALAVASAMEPERKTPLAAVAQTTLPDGSGRLVALYASQPNETAREVALPPNLPLEKRSWGSIFTTALTQVLKRSPALSYRQALVEAGRVLRADPAFQAQQTPSFEGDGLDMPLPGAASAAAAAWRVDAGTLHAGQIEGVEDGAILALYVAPDAPVKRPLGHAQVKTSGPLEAQLTGLKAGCQPASGKCISDPANAILKNARYARLVRPGDSGTIKISSPRLWPGLLETPQHAALRSALGAALTGPLQNRIVIDDSAAEFTSWLGADGLRFMPAGIDPAKAEQGPGGAPGENADASTTNIARALLRVRQISLLRRLERVASASSLQHLALSPQTKRFAYDEQRRQCAFAGPHEIVAEGASVGRCDKVELTIENQSQKTVMPAVFFLDGRWNLIAIRPTCPVGLTVADRLEPGKHMIVEVPYHAKAISAGRAPGTINGLFVAGIPFVAGETDLPNLCSLAAFNDGPAQATRGLGNSDELDDLIVGTRGGPRLALEGTTLSLSFWPVTQPVKP